MGPSHVLDLHTQVSVEQDDPIPGVNPATGHFHISLLRKFDQLYSSLERGGDQDGSGENTSLRAFLVLAEARYLQYVKLLSEFSQKAPKHEQFVDIMPLPPWDVAIIFHSHCLNPISFTTDFVKSFGILLEAEIKFPLERLHSLIKLGTNSHAESERQWNEYQANLGRNASSIPYQLSPTLPHHLSYDDLWKTTQIYSSCPECKRDIGFGWAELTAMRLTTNLIRCTNCKTEFSGAPFPTDLVAAGLRQRSFAAKMANDRFFALDVPSSLEKAISRYRRFMFLDVDNKAEDCGIVPTLDIDLIWHTHQLSPVGYRRWCLSNLNEYINHDDTVGDSDLAVGLNRTVDIWYEKFGEKYEIGGFPKQTKDTQRDRPVASYCEYNDLCWLGRSSWDSIRPTSDKADSEENVLSAGSATELLISCRYRCAKCFKADCHKPSRKEVEDLLSCRYRCAKCFKADCHKPSRKEAELLTCPS